jgi:hypothetical protein
MAIIYTNQSSGRKRKSKSKRLALARKEHGEFIASLGYTGKPKGKNLLAAPKQEKKPDEVQLSNTIPGNCFKTSIDDWKWKKGCVESPATIEEIERKKKRVAPLWNKGATMFITDNEDPKTLGRKI